MSGLLVPCRQPIKWHHRMEESRSNVSARSSRNVDVDVLRRDEATVDKSPDLGQHGIDLLNRINGLDHHGQVLAQAQNVRRVENCRTSVAGDTSENGRAQDLCGSEGVDDSVCQRKTVPMVTLADEDPEQPAFYDVVHGTHPIAALRRPRSFRRGLECGRGSGRLAGAETVVFCVCRLSPLPRLF